MAGRALPRHIAGLFTNRGNSPRPMCSVTHLVRTVLLFNELKCVDLLPRDPWSPLGGRGKGTLERMRRGSVSL